MKSQKMPQGTKKSSAKQLKSYQKKLVKSKEVAEKKEKKSWSKRLDTFKPVSLPVMHTVSEISTFDKNKDELYSLTQSSHQSPINRHPRRYEKNDQPSLTLPDQTMSIQTIIKRYAAGLALPGVKVPVYKEFDILQGVNPATLDISEKMEILDTLQNKLSVAENKKQVEQLEAQRKKVIDDYIQSLPKNEEAPQA